MHSRMATKPNLPCLRFQVKWNNGYWKVFDRLA